MKCTLRSLSLILWLYCPALIAETPRLVLQITVDGLRGDLIERYAHHFGENGFNYLLNRGVVYTNAHYLHANTETIVGHTTLATGATPAVHGMVGNVWYDANSGELGYNIEDADSPLIPTRTTTAKGDQVDPAQKMARSSGRSPVGILAPTFSDTLKIATAGKARVFGISGKDRGAVSMAGKTGTAYWYSTNTGDFESSSFYMNQYPGWVVGWNEKRIAEQSGGESWELSREKDQYLFMDQDDRPYEVDLKGYGRTFPHPFPEKNHPLFFTLIQVGPEGDRILLDFGKSLVKAEKLGQDEVPDYLSISFSAVDVVNHFFGPASLESEETILQLDRTLAGLFEYIEARVGLENTLIVFSADHGMSEMPEYSSELGYEAGRIYGDEILAMSREISKKLFDRADVVKDFFRPYLYLDSKVLNESGLDRSAVAEAIAIELGKTRGISDAVPGHGLQGSSVGGVVASIRHNHHPDRSGDIYVFQAPNWFMFERGPAAAMHGSPWKYDSHVPVIFAGAGIKPAIVNRLVHPIDVAPTLSALMKLSPPASSQGSVLTEVLDQQIPH